jgi:hypothetical protein
VVAMIGHRRIAIVTFALIAQGCATGRFGPAPSTRVPEGKRTLNNLSVNEREATLERAKVWQAIDTLAQPCGGATAPVRSEDSG